MIITVVWAGAQVAREGAVTSVIPRYTLPMKTAISVPDATFERAERRARELGVSRSELYSTAMRHWLDALDDQRVTEQIDQALAMASQDDDELMFVRRAATRLANQDFS